MVGVPLPWHVPRRGRGRSFYSTAIYAILAIVPLASFIAILLLLFAVMLVVRLSCWCACDLGKTYSPSSILEVILITSWVQFTFALVTGNPSSILGLDTM